MPIEVTITKSPENVNLNKTSQSFSESGGTIGRGPDNTWVLDDPQKYMSSRHTQLGFEDGQYVLIDISTNGTFVNGAGDPLGNGNKIILNEGDRFAISDYEFVVSISAGQADEGLFGDPMESGPFAEQAGNNPADFAVPMASDPFGGPLGLDDPLINDAQPMHDPSPFQNVPPPNPVDPIINNSIPEIGNSEMDPLAAFDKVNANNSSMDLYGRDSNDYPLPVENSYPQNAYPENSQSDSSGYAPFTNDRSVADNSPAVNEAISWPKSNIESGGEIPDDWDLDEPAPARSQTPGVMPVFTPPVAPPPPPPSAPPPPAEPSVNSFSNIEALSRLENEYLLLENENKKLMSEIARLRHHIKNNKPAAPQPAQPVQQASSPRAYSMDDQSLIDAMGLGEWNLDQEKSKQISATVGILIRETLEGMMRVLSFRKKIKEEFRINVTTIQPIENNPLKFSANIDDAMENMFIKDNKAYKEPVEAVREGFQGIAEHQVAVLAGMQAAFRGMLERFDPLTLEKRFEKYHKSGLLQFGTKGKNWESYVNYHHGLTNDVENSFQHLFGYDFVQAYEDQLQRLLIARKTTKKSNTN